MKRAWVTAAVICFLLSYLSPVMAWWGKQDNKPVEELQLMTEYELGNYAGYVCVGGAMSKVREPNKAHPKAYIEAVDYIMTISRVVRAQTGKESSWQHEYVSAMETGDPERCIDVYKKFFLEKKPK